MLQQRIVFVEDLHVIFNGLLKVKCNITAKSCICERFACHIQ
uniref:Uncharacterized protein n=1 Tax=viral metagenome TaxID=1070528 RepID=A0A6C0C8K4_9ZZZZ